MKPTSLEALCARYIPLTGAAPPDMQRELGRFDVFSLGKLRPGHAHRPPTPFNRQAFYKISLTHGRGRIEYADHAIEVGPHTLFFATPRTSYRWVPLEAPTGYSPSSSGLTRQQLGWHPTQPGPLADLERGNYFSR